MELKVIEESKNSMTFELEGEQHTFPTLLCWALLKDPRVKIAVYDLDHPLVGTPRVHLTTSRKKPRNAVKSAISLLEKELKDLEKTVGKSGKKSKK